MASSPFTLLLLRRPILSSKTRLKPHSFSSSPVFSTIKPKPFSSVSPQPEGIAGHEPLKPTSLSARLNFVFDQIDQIEKRKQQESLENDDTLQRIRAWRQSNKESQPTQRRYQSKEQNPDSGITRNDENPTEFSSSSSPELTESQSDDVLRRIRVWRESKYGGNKECSEGESAENESKVGVFTTDSVTELELCRQKGKDVEFVHPWPEWIELMERLVQQNYFDHKRIDEEKMVEELGFDMSNVVEEVKDDAGIDFKDFKTVQTACLNFGKDRFDILRSLSRQDIQNLVGFGCPSADKKVVFSAKVLRKHVHLDEGDVCSSCSLRNSCEKAYLPTNKEDEARTIDVMRVLLTYGFDYVNGSGVNESVLKQKSLKTVVRKLLYKVVKLSAVPIDPNLPPPVTKKPPPKVKQPPPPKRVGRDDIEMKKGDWLCPKCDFMNFAKNTVCLQCDAKRPKRQLLPGEWECPGCNFLNYRRNMACFHCDCKRPPDAFMESKIQEIRPGSRTRLEKTARRSEVSNGWNFDFDDDESDGADVASFEYADSSLKAEASPLGNQARGGKFRGFEDDFDTGRRVSRVHERIYSDIDSSKPGIGFDDFDDEDDIDSYEIDSRQNNPRQKAYLNVYSDNELFSEFEDGDGSNDSIVADQRTRFPSYSKPSKHERKKVTLFDSDDELDLDSDEDLSVRPNWKPRHVADTKHGGRSNFRNRGSSGFQGGSFSGSDYENDGPHSKRNEPRRNKLGSIRPVNNVGGRGDYNSRNNSPSRSNTKMNGGRNYSDNSDRSYRDSRGNSRRFGEDDYGKQRFKGGKKDGASGNRYRGKSHEYSREMDDPSEFKNSRRVIER